MQTDMQKKASAAEAEPINLYIEREVCVYRHTYIRLYVRLYLPPPLYTRTLVPKLHGRPLSSVVLFVLLDVERFDMRNRSALKS